jgi:hypothetical protein
MAQPVADSLASSSRAGGKKAKRRRRVVVVELDAREGDRLWAWCKAGGVVTNQLWPGYSESGRGLHATSAVRGPGELLLRIPARLLYNTRTIRTDPTLGLLLFAAKEAGVPLLSPLATLCFGLVHERALGAGSRWAPFFDSFPAPREMITAEQMTESELAAVPWAPALQAEARTQRQQLAAAQQLITALLDWAAVAARSGLAAVAAAIARQLCVKGSMSWAWSVISTRTMFMDQAQWSGGLSFGGAPTGPETGRGLTEKQVRQLADGTEDTSTLVPWLDLINHTSSGSTQAAGFRGSSYRERAGWMPPDDENVAVFGGFMQNSNRADSGGYEVRSSAAIARGKAIYLCYDANVSNEMLLARYGFIDGDHPADAARLHPLTGLARLLALAAVRRQARSGWGSSRCAQWGGGEGGAALCWGEEEGHHCASCSGRVATLVAAGLWPMEVAGDLCFFAPPPPAVSDEPELAAAAAAIVSWNLLTIARVVTASDAEAALAKTAGGSSAMQQVLGDAPLSAASEAEAWQLLQDVVAAELRDLQHIPEQPPEGDAGEGVEEPTAKQRASQRAKLLWSLTAARRQILCAASAAMYARAGP